VQDGSALRMVQRGTAVERTQEERGSQCNGHCLQSEPPSDGPAIRSHHASNHMSLLAAYARTCVRIN
jgi:hypothetical protein